MLRILGRLLAKTSVAPVRRKILKRLPRRTHLVGGSGKAGRKIKTVRKGSLSNSVAVSANALRRNKDDTQQPPTAGTRSSSNGVTTANTTSTSTVIATMEGTAATTAAAAGEQALAPSSELAPRRLNYRLATAVATVVVPPMANKVLEGMKQIITPAARRPAHDDDRDGSSGQQVMEEYYTSRKGPLFATAVIAGTNAVKQASALIPFCHPVPVQKCSFTFRRRVVADGLRPTALPHRVVLRKRAAPPLPLPSKPECSVLYCFCTVATEEYKTGVEMEALTGATMAAITLYDMLKTLPGAQEDGLQLSEAFVLAKRGGKNDFIKLLMSESARGAGSKALPGPTSMRDTTEVAPGAASRTEDGKAAQAAATPSSVNSAPRADKNGEPGDEEEEAAAGVAGPRVVRRLPQLESAGAGRGNHGNRSGSSNVTNTSSPLLPGDTGAWWRSSKHERRLQELYPRRKYGEGARVAEPGVAPAGSGVKGQEDDDMAAAAKADEVAQVDEGEEEEGENEADAGLELSAAKGSRGHNAGQRQGIVQSRSAAASRLGEAVARRDAATEDREEEEEVDEEHDDAVGGAESTSLRVAGRRPVAVRAGRPAKATGEAKPITTALATARARVKGAASAAVRQRASRATTAHPASGEANDAAEEDEEGEDGAHADEHDDAVEDERVTVTRGSGQMERRGGKGRDTKSAAVAAAPASRTRRAAKTAATVDEDTTAREEELTQDEEDNAAVEDDATADDEEAADEEEEEEIHMRGQATPVARLKSRATGGTPHEASSAPLRRPKRSPPRAAEEASKSQPALRSRRTGAEGRGDGALRRHGRDARHDEYVSDHAAERADAEDADEDEGYNDEVEEQEDDVVVMPRRAPSTPQHRRRAHEDESPIVTAAARRRAVGEMMPVQHDSWDNETIVMPTEPARPSTVSRKLKKKSVSRR